MHQAAGIAASAVSARSESRCALASGMSRGKCSQLVRLQQLAGYLQDCRSCAPETCQAQQCCQRAPGLDPPDCSAWNLALLRHHQHQYLSIHGVLETGKIRSCPRYDQHQHWCKCCIVTKDRTISLLRQHQHQCPYIHCRLKKRRGKKSKTVKSHILICIFHQRQL